jgi:hypothetical protein
VIREVFLRSFYATATSAGLDGADLISDGADLLAAKFGARLLEVAEDRTDCVQAGRQAAEAATTAKRAAQQVLEQMLKVEASFADICRRGVCSTRVRSTSPGRGAEGYLPKCLSNMEDML